jgi:hypothetical protein
MAAGNSPSSVNIHRIPRASAQRVRLLLEANREMPHISEIGLYNEALGAE